MPVWITTPSPEEVPPSRVKKLLPTYWSKRTPASHSSSSTRCRSAASRRMQLVSAALVQKR
jgi:hypothetical protein